MRRPRQLPRRSRPDRLSIAPQAFSPARASAQREPRSLVPWHAAPNERPGVASLASLARSLDPIGRCDRGEELHQDAKVVESARRDELRTRRTPAELAEFAWLVEELRVQTFAPELKTAVPVSAQRVEDAWARLIR